MKHLLILVLLVLAITCFQSLQGQVPQAYVQAVEGDCSKYKMCDQSGCFVLQCGAGTEFNPYIMTCDYPLQDRTNCGNRG